MWRIRDRETFARLRRSRTRARLGTVAVTRTPLPVGATEPAVAFAVSRKVGSAVVRNRLRRQLRASLQEQRLPPAAYLITLRPGAGDRSPAELRAELAGALRALPASDPS